MKLKVIDNFLQKNYFEVLKNEFTNAKFPWYLQKGKVHLDDGYFQFTHIFFDNNKTNGTYFNILEPFLWNLDVKSLVRAKMNLTIKENIIKPFDFHSDVDFVCNTAVFYLNTNNGKTIFENKEEVESVENRIVIFPSNLKHTGTTHTDVPHRIVLNLNYF